VEGDIHSVVDDGDRSGGVVQDTVADGSEHEAAQRAVPSTATSGNFSCQPAIDSARTSRSSRAAITGT